MTIFMAILYRRGVSRTILFQCLALLSPKKGSKDEKSFLVTHIVASGGVFGTPGLDIFKLVPCKFREGKLSSFPPLSRIYGVCTFSAPPSLYSARAGAVLSPPTPQGGQMVGPRKKPIDKNIRLKIRPKPEFWALFHFLLT